jgi:hypothetical protein
MITLVASQAFHRTPNRRDRKFTTKTQQKTENSRLETGGSRTISASPTTTLTKSRDTNGDESTTLKIEQAVRLSRDRKMNSAKRTQGRRQRLNSEMKAAAT